MVKASLCNSCCSCVCRSASFFLRIWTPISTMFSGFREPHDSTLKKNLLALAA